MFQFLKEEVSKIVPYNLFKQKIPWPFFGWVSFKWGRLTPEKAELFRHQSEVGNSSETEVAWKSPDPPCSYGKKKLINETMEIEKHSF